ncbi:hypothetical protein [Bacillus sp. ISL-45]|uniref:hypothetical protein n=1 Tax=Bacillus sp. ISL-45 TaxID=2819128 RepID=UPI001BE99608|nr:hypothetical protein [Bacillus sp. ISL-45]MBT2663392.1 hypothetical protein [Bacillus sp. ISL-45]
MFVYYLMLFMGTLFVIIALFSFIAMFREKSYPVLEVGKSILGLSMGVLILAVTLPSIKYVVLKEYDIISGECVIEIDSAGRSSLADFRMVDSGEIFIFSDIPDLDAYGRSVPYYCEVTATKDHMVEIDYKIYDIKTRKLILSSE